MDAAKTRIHGDYHLGQILLAHDDWVIVDFEGEPAMPLEQRLCKSSPLRDVAGMLRSFDYAAAMALRRLAQTNVPIAENVQAFAHAWRDSAQQAFLDAWTQIIDGAPSYPASRDDAARWLALFTLEKACYELVYEARNRPDWLLIPVSGTKELLDANRR
jgi:maltose alpha-D-glucosyltransferase/alpha-amylase